MNFKKICILGLGYIGLPTACTFATHGIQVVGVDVNIDVLATLQRGEIHIHEPGLRGLVEEAIVSGRLSFSREPEEADAFIIAVPTPFHMDEHGSINGQEYKLADMEAVRSAAESIIPVLRKGNLVVLESTSPPRTTVDLVAPLLEKSGLKAGAGFPPGLFPRTGSSRADPEGIGRECTGHWRDNSRGCRGRTGTIFPFRKGGDTDHRCNHGRDGQVNGEHIPGY